MSSSNKKKYKLRKGRVFAVGAMALLIIAAVIALVIKLTGKNNNTNSSGSHNTINANDATGYGEFVKIQLNDCNMYIGSSVKLTCTSNPEEYASMVTWTSSNPDVVSVAADGRIYVKGTGVAAITAQYKLVSGSVTIKGIDREKPEIDENMAVVEVEDDVPVEVQTARPTDVQETSSVTPTETTEDDSDAPIESSNTSQEISQPETSAESTTEPPVTTQPESETEDEETRKAMVKAVTINTISEYGLEGYLGNTYLIKEDGNYLGEIIVDDNFVQIYVQTRTSRLDEIVRAIAKNMMPGSYENVFAVFVSANEEVNFTSEGHKIRVVSPKNGGHSQLIIYY